MPKAAENSAVSRKWTVFHLSVAGPNDVDPFPAAF